MKNFNKNLLVVAGVVLLILGGLIFIFKGGKKGLELGIEKIAEVQFKTPFVLKVGEDYVFKGKLYMPDVLDPEYAEYKVIDLENGKVKAYKIEADIDNSMAFINFSNFGAVEFNLELDDATQSTFVLWNGDKKEFGVTSFSDNMDANKIDMLGATVVNGVAYFSMQDGVWAVDPEGNVKKWEYGGLSIYKENEKVRYVIGNKTVAEKNFGFDIGNLSKDFGERQQGRFYFGRVKPQKEEKFEFVSYRVFKSSKGYTGYAATTGVYLLSSDEIITGYGTKVLVFSRDALFLKVLDFSSVFSKKMKKSTGVVKVWDTVVTSEVAYSVKDLAGSVVKCSLLSAKKVKGKGEDKCIAILGLVTGDKKLVVLKVVF